MRYELECGHCGYQFVLDVAVLPRATRCDVCGGTLTIAIPVPLVPKAPPPAPAKPPPPSPHAPAHPRGFPAPKVRARTLAAPWGTVRQSLHWARVTTDFAAALVAVLAVAIFFFGPRVRSETWWVVEQLPAAVVCALLLLAVIHTGCQWLCAAAPRMRGAFTNASLLTLPSTAGGCALGWFPGWAGVFFAVFGAAAFAISFGYWLAFLGRLGQRLGDDALADAVRSYRQALPFGLVLLAVLLIGAILAAQAPSPPLVWVGRAGAGVLGVVLLRQYSVLLRAAVQAIDCRAPVVLDR